MNAEGTVKAECGTRNEKALSLAGLVSPGEGHLVSPGYGRLVSPPKISYISSMLSKHGGGYGADTHE